MKRLPWERGRRGFTLIEVTVALGIFAIVMLGLAAVAGISAQGGYASKQRLRATYLATRMLETLSSPDVVTDANLGFFDGDDTANPATYQADPTAAVTAEWAQTITTQMGPGAWGTIGVEQDQPTTGNSRITVTVSWPYRGRTVNVTMVAVR